MAWLFDTLSPSGPDRTGIRRITHIIKPTRIPNNHMNAPVKIRPSLTLINKEAGHDGKPGKHDARRIHRMLWRFTHGTRNQTDVLLLWLDMRLSINSSRADKHATSNKVIFT